MTVKFYLPIYIIYISFLNMDNLEQTAEFFQEQAAPKEQQSASIRRTATSTYDTRPKIPGKFQSLPNPKLNSPRHFQSTYSKTDVNLPLLHSPRTQRTTSAKQLTSPSSLLKMEKNVLQKIFKF
ncbi:hypothetical protein pb186bvf_010792 [Paramecium bursaria]